MDTVLGLMFICFRAGIAVGLMKSVVEHSWGYAFLFTALTLLLHLMQEELNS